jgi:hypothetical protein
MSSICGSNMPMESGVDTLLKENWNWVDKRLEELYYGYGLTSDNYDDYIDAGLLVEMGAWVDEKLQSQFDVEFEDKILCPASMSWVLYKETPKQYCLEAEPDISNHSSDEECALNMIDVESFPPHPIDNSYLYAVADEVSSMLSDLEEFENCSPISACSHLTNLDMNDPFYEYCCEDRFK